MSWVSNQGKDLSLVRFFNCYDLSDCTLEIVEADDFCTILRTMDNVNILRPMDNAKREKSSVESIVATDSKEHEPICVKRRKLENCSILKKVEEQNETEKTILFIHSLLFCSNSEYFQKILMSGSRQRNVKIVLKPGETEPFTKLIKLFYDESQISELSVLETAQVLQFAKRYQCLNITKKLLHHISSFKINSVSTMNRSVDVYNDLLENNDKNMSDILSRLKNSCLRYLKDYYCPLEKVFGPLLFDFVKLSGASLRFLLDYVDCGIAVSEGTVVGLVLYWLEYNSIISNEHSPAFGLELLKKCRFEHVHISYIMDVLCLPQPSWLSGDYQRFYTHIVEYQACLDKFSYFPDFPKRKLRTRNFAYDHEMFLYFGPRGVDTVKKENGEDQLLFTANQNVAFVQGYQIHFTAGAFQTEGNRELRVKLSVENMNRIPHSQLRFSMLYAIASPSVSEHFSPWNHCTIIMDSQEKSAWAVISLIAEHSLINQTGFYLKFYLE